MRRVNINIQARKWFLISCFPTKKCRRYWLTKVIDFYLQWILFCNVLHQSTKTAVGMKLTMPSSPHEFFKAFLLSSDYRPSVDRPSTERWPITDRYIREVSTNYQRSVGQVLVNEKLYRPRHIWNDYRPCLDRVSSDYLPSLDRLSNAISTESRPTIDRLSTECRPSFDRVSTDYRPLYRPIDRSTLPKANMIRGFPSWFELWSFSVLLRHSFAILDEFYKVVV